MADQLIRISTFAWLSIAKVKIHILLVNNGAHALAEKAHSNNACKQMKT